ncbi:Mannan endo-1,4-beta-mannosidase 2 [Apostasia shenzhenica]|uniref:mannan endo-1,4-beta-mannosidase n=1 Tax=Apostasia shenzhenica TaxID=1088818 RepID=A0A2I0BC41_9ASPA|nr:Mannan endo-1,4-beta-mannosidase 2 [Apostasia shenzhenica]
MLAGQGFFYPIVGLASCVAFIYMSFGDLAFPLMQSQMNFVEREGTQLIVDGNPFYVNGWNSYWLMSQSVEETSRPRMNSMFETAARLGLTVCRTWAFNDGTYNALQVSPGQFDERVFEALDRVIWEARMHKVRLLLSLANDWKDFGGKVQYVKWAWEAGLGSSSSNDSFFFDPSIRRYFKDYIKAILTRRNHLTGIQYRDDPTVFAWELMNEPHCPSDPSGDIVQNWIEEMAKYVKTIDKKHLLTVGFEGFYGPSSPKKLELNPAEDFNKLGLDFIRNSKVEEIDFASVHIYPDLWLPPGTNQEQKIRFVSKWVSSHIEDGEKVLRKPVLFTEFGLSSKNKNFSHGCRDELFKHIFDLIYNSARTKGAGAGSFIWQLIEEGMEEFRDEFGIVAGERLSIFRLIKEQSCRLAEISRGGGWGWKGSKGRC